MKRISASQYATALYRAYENAAPDQRPIVIKTFLHRLAQHRSWKLIPRILAHLQALQDQRAGQTRVHVRSATQLDQAQFEKYLTDKLGPVALETSVDPALIGGIELRIGDRLIRGSLQERLRQLHHQLIQE